MIELFFYMSPNVQKIVLFLEESGLDYRLTVVDITKGEQYAEPFVGTFPNSRLPAIIDHSPPLGGDPITVFESGAILIYLAEKSGRFLAADPAGKVRTLQWLFWQIGGLGPIGGQLVHFRNYAPQVFDYPIARFGAEHRRLLGVLDKVLADRPFISGDYSIADMACAPWLYAHDRRGQLNLDGLPHVARWYAEMRDRPAFIRAYDVLARIAGGVYVANRSMLDADARRILFGTASLE